MAIYRIFPKEDSWITSETPTANTGLDEIVEIGGFEDATGVGRTNRILTKFETADLQEVFQKYPASLNISASLNYFLAEASNLPVSYSIECYPVAQGWDNGKGKYGDIPIDITGVSWLATRAGGSGSWTTSGFPTNTTASFSTYNPGGGLWYTGSNGVDLKATKTFNIYEDHDISVDVSTAIDVINSGSIPNYGFILKLENNLENNTETNIRLRFFSKDTNTVYPPYLELKWDDSSYSTGSLAVLSTDVATIGIKNNKEKYLNEGKIRFRITSKPKYPTRSFTTSSIYLTNYALPENSYWGVKDEHSEEMVVPFGSFTKISCDNSGPYFDVFMNSFQPERYYRVLIKTTLDSSEVVYADKNIFKVVRNV